MAILSIPFTFSAGQPIIASQHNLNFSTIYTDYSGNIQNVNIASGAAIAYSKLSLSGSIVNADINASAAIVGSKLNLTSPGAIGSTAPSTGAFTTFKFGTTHQGDIPYDNGTSISRLTPGTSGQILTTQGASANPIWTNGPALTLISNTVVSTATNTGDIAITSSNYYLIQANISALSSNSDAILIRINNDTGSVYKYVYSGNDTSGALSSSSASATSILSGTAISGNNIARLQMKIFPQNGTGEIYITGRIIYFGAAFGYVDFYGFYANTIAATSFRLLTSGSETFSGNVYLYKYALS